MAVGGQTVRRVWRERGEGTRGGVRHQGLLPQLRAELGRLPVLESLNVAGNQLTHLSGMQSLARGQIDHCRMQHSREQGRGTGGTGMVDRSEKNS